MTTDTQNFWQVSSRIMQEASDRAKTLPANTVQVWPGGAKFTTIQAAINSILDASPALQYQVSIGPGTYNERVELKANIFLGGAGQDQTTISIPATTMPSGTLMTAGDGGASMLTVLSTGSAEGNYCCALYIMMPGAFNASGLTLTATDAGNGNCNVFGVTNQNGANSGTVHIGSSTITATVVNQTSGAVGVVGEMSGFSYDIELSTIVGGGAGGTGLLCTNQATATVEDTTLTGLNWTLWNYDLQSPITATRCTFNGPVSGGVIVN
jgi:pectin methylesterase-like acyl-CoA thioesterase